MAAIIPAPTTRYALVTGANKGIGFEICRQLASKDITVILTSRDEKRGIEAQQKLKEFHNLDFHQLNVLDPASVAALVHFIKTKYGRLDILVNNAGVLGVRVDGDALIVQEWVESAFASILAGELQPFHPKPNGKFIETFKDAEECIQTNYFGVKRVTQALVPLLQLSQSPRIVNVSSTMGSLVIQPNGNEWAKEVWRRKEGLTEESIDQVVEEFMKDFKEGSLEQNHWPLHASAYKVSKAALNAYTRFLARKYPSFLVNSVCPGFTRTELTYNIGFINDVLGAETPVKLALLPDAGPSGFNFLRDEVISL